MKVLVTGATGFVGARLVQRLRNEDACQVLGAVRREHAVITPDIFVCGDIGPSTDWAAGLAGVDAVVHCAARVHVMDELAADPLVAFRRVNVEGTLNLARQAVAAGVRRFVFVSSIKVNGELTVKGRPFTADDEPHPVDPYGISKFEAEQGLMALGHESGMEIVIVRPVLVYGPGVKANFLRMMKWVCRGIPLPFGAVHNQRSLVALDNLVDLLATCMKHPAAAGQIFIACDGEDLSTSDLLRRLARALGSPSRLLPVPSFLLIAASVLLGRSELSQRLCGSLQADAGKVQRVLNWTPPLSVDEALKQTADYFLEHQA
ncbi:MAG: SDR family oxidoreductase [Moraxellaceae bacterium]|jgi:nucleoside-diphosphate-sugar epimerase|nr:SDR family oxidoreductase [Moraxellaceae bacterium]MBP8853023.1 SDR family oxidoreductase [Moraxellaceae bacterium]MBP9046126.1 SDR family oxidoreductase [Moraxellaceae bacterium]HQV42347.1 SDR family oxidoreductase [Moraxellaceae bacterium]HQX90321.1 SDR family oxidoreductase [Moraxellaceae bacterium]